MGSHETKLAALNGANPHKRGPGRPPKSDKPKRGQKPIGIPALEKQLRGARGAFLSELFPDGAEAAGFQIGDRRSAEWRQGTVGRWNSGWFKLWCTVRKIKPSEAAGQIRTWFAANENPEADQPVKAHTRATSQRKQKIIDVADIKTEFARFATGIGLVEPKGGFVADGKLHRCDVASSPKDKKNAGSYQLFADGCPAGWAQNWTDGAGPQNWSLRSDTALTEAERAELRQRMEQTRKARENEEAKRHKEAAKEAHGIWGDAKAAAPSDHPYLVKKGIEPHGLRIHEGRLVMALHDAEGAVHSLQYIDDQGGKLFLTGGRKRGLFYRIGNIDPAGDILIGEGFATMASLHEATGKPSVVAMDCTNLAPVAEALRRKYPRTRLIFCADHDAWTKGNPGKSKGHQAAAAVGGLIAVPEFAGLRSNGETDFNDLHRVEDLHAVRRCIEAAQAVPSEKPKNSSGEDRTQAQKILGLVGDIEFFHDTEREPYARICEGDRRIVALIDTKTFKRVLRHRFYRQYGSGMNDESMRAAIQTLEARALFDGPQYDVYLRTARHGGNLYLNLACDDGSVVEITPNGWSVVTEPPVRFVRPPAMRALPMPQRGGSITALVRLLNVATWRDFVLSVSWLLGALNSGECPYPIAAFTGEQGTAKSSSTKNLRRLIDPNRAPLRSLPREERDLAITAKGSHVLTFDNLSGLPAWTSDALCKLATGGGFSCRELYSNDGEFIFDGRRPIIMNGIEDFATRGDLADRCMFLRLNPIPEQQRKTEAEIDAIFAEEAPKLLGILLDAAAYGLANPVTLPKRPRMADFAEWVAACEGFFNGTILPFQQANGRNSVWRSGDFMKAYDTNRKEATETVLDADAVAVAILSFMDDRTTWTGTATDLRTELSQLVPEDVRRDREWPASARALSGRLTRLGPALRRSLIEAERHKLSGGKRVITIKRIEPEGDEAAIVEEGNFAPSAPNVHAESENSFYINGLDEGASKNGVAPKNGLCAQNGEFAPNVADGLGANHKGQNGGGVLRPDCAPQQGIENDHKIAGLSARAQWAQNCANSLGEHAASGWENAL